MSLRSLINEVRAILERKDLTPPASADARFRKKEKRLAKADPTPAATLQRTRGKWLDRGREH